MCSIQWLIFNNCAKKGKYFCFKNGSYTPKDLQLRLHDNQKSCDIYDMYLVNICKRYYIEKKSDAIYFLLCPPPHLYFFHSVTFSITFWWSYGFCVSICCYETLTGLIIWKNNTCNTLANNYSILNSPLWYAIGMTICCLELLSEALVRKRWFYKV